MTVAAELRTDEQIQRDVLSELKWEASLQPNEIGVAVKDGVVTLTGWVDTYMKRWAAEEAAHRVRGVRAVANEIEVRLPGSSVRTDADLAAEVSRALERNILVPHEKIDVTVSDGWVRLDGEVRWQFERTEAERAVRRIPGVRGVTNAIAVRPKVHPSPTEMKRKIEEALIRNAEIDAERINVDVQGDTVILTGTVRSWAEREAAARAAWSAPGVVAVHNQIVVQ